MLSNASKYAIRAVLFLANKSSNTQKYGSKHLADSLEIPNPFLAKLLQQLSRAGVISSTKGPGGGFYLTDQNRQRHISDILNVIEKENVLHTCLMGLPRCGDANPCPIHHLAAPFMVELRKKFNVQTIDELANEVKENGTYLTLKGLDDL